MASAEPSRRVEKVVGLPAAGGDGRPAAPRVSRGAARRRELRGPAREVAGRDPRGGSGTAAAPGGDWRLATARLGNCNPNCNPTPHNQPSRAVVEGVPHTRIRWKSGTTATAPQSGITAVRVEEVLH